MEIENMEVIDMKIEKSKNISFGGMDGLCASPLHL